MNTNIERIYKWWEFYWNYSYICENNNLYRISKKFKDILWIVTNRRIRNAIRNKNFSIKNEKEFLNKFLKEIEKIYKIKKESLSLKENTFLEFYQKNFYFWLRYLLFNHSKAIIKTEYDIIEFIKWKEDYFKFYEYEFFKNDKPVFSKFNYKLFKRFYSDIPENVVLLGSQILKYKNIDTEFEKKLKKYDKCSVRKFWKTITNRKNRKNIKRILKNNMLNENLADIEIPKFKKDTWAFV